jgi:hypothetical protein
LTQIKNAVYIVLITLYCLVLFIASGIAALFIILTGLKYMTSEDAAGRVEARKRLVYSLAGLMLVALACPLVNMLFSGTNIGVDDGTGHKTPCPGCPLIGELTTSSGSLGGFGGWFRGGDTQGSWFTESRIKQAKSFQVCTTPSDCPSDRVCASNNEADASGMVYRCFPKIADGYSISSSGLTPLSGDNADLCNSGFVSGDKCGRDLKCQNRNGCKSGEYCGSDAYCKTKKETDKDCSAGIMLGDTNPDYVCQSNWCVDGKCMDSGNCAGPDDCNRHYSGAFCNGNYLCEWKRSEKAECKASQIIGGTANDICKSGTCKSSDKCA